MSGKRVTLTIPGDPPPGANAQHRMHWAEVGRLRGYWRTQAWYAWHGAGRPRFEHPRIAVRFVYRLGRRRDLDNLGVAVKPIIDGLRDDPRTGSVGAFADDDAASIDLRPIELAVDKLSPRVEVVLEETAQDRTRLKGVAALAAGVGVRSGIGRTSHVPARSPDPALEARLRCRIDEARAGRKWSCYEAIRLLKQAGRFEGLTRQGARKVVARALGGVDPDIVAEMWAQFLVGGGLR